MERKVKGTTIWKALIVISMILGIAIVILPSILYTSDSYVGEFIIANKVYMNDGSINLVIYFNETTGGTHYLIFEVWDAKHSVILSNMDVGEQIKVSYRDYIVSGRTIVNIEVL